MTRVLTFALALYFILLGVGLCAMLSLPAPQRDVVIHPRVEEPAYCHAPRLEMYVECRYLSWGGSA